MLPTRNVDDKTPSSRAGVLPVRRVAVTVPPAGWFHGISKDIWAIYRQALVELGLTIFDVPVDAFLPPDINRIKSLIDDLRAFQPELALGLHSGSVALLCRLPPDSDGWRPNLFVDVLDIPTICLWDTAPVGLAEQILSPLPNEPADSEPGALEILRRTLCHPRLVHWSRDSGQTQVMKEMSLVLPDAVLQVGSPALPGFSPQELSMTPRDSYPQISFFGHLYQQNVHVRAALLERLAADSIDAWISQHRAGLWFILDEKIAALPAEQRCTLALEHDQTFFWRFSHDFIVHEAQTAQRLHMLGAVGRRVACYGNLDVNAPGVSPNLHHAPGFFRFGPELSAALARHPVTIDVLNPGFIAGYSYKPLLGFASGGFMLVDRKDDFISSFGEIGEAVSYIDADDLASKVDLYVGNPRLRREIGDAIRSEISTKHMLHNVLARIIEDTWSRSAALPRSKPLAQVVSVPVIHATESMDLLPGLQTWPHWKGATIDHRADGIVVTTPAQLWAPAAEFPITRLPPSAHKPYVCLDVVVEAGRVGIAAIRRNGKLMSEQVISAAPRQVTVELFILAADIVTIQLRNTSDGPSRIVVKRAKLYEQCV